MSHDATDVGVITQGTNRLREMRTEPSFEPLPTLKGWREEKVPVKREENQDCGGKKAKARDNPQGKRDLQCPIPL